MEEKIGFIGAGKMAEAIIKGIISQEVILSDKIYISDLNQTRLESLTKEYGVNASKSNKELVKEVDIIILAVKPQVINPVLSEIKDVVTNKQTVYSIAAGVSIKQIEKSLTKIGVLRLMPNTPALVGAGAIAYSAGTKAEARDKKILEDIFTAVGSVVEIKEELMDAVTALSGSGPAYIYLFAEALTDAGVNVGLPREIAKQLALQTIEGSVKMIKETGQHPAQLKDMVTSPGGTTISALKSLENDGLRAAIYNAVQAANDKSKSLQGVD